MNDINDMNDKKKYPYLSGIVEAMKIKEDEDILTDAQFQDWVDRVTGTSKSRKPIKN